MKRDFLINETFDGSFPFKPNFKNINGFEMHYIDEGKGEVILCHHGMPTWSYLYREFIKELAKDHRIIVPDAMGFGKSDVPQDKPYLMEQHVDNLAKLVFDLDLSDITLVVQDWGGPIGLGFAVDHPERIKRLVIMNTSIGVMKEGSKPWYHAMEKMGKYVEFIKNTSNIIKMGMYRKEKITKSLLNAYAAPFPSDGYYVGALAWPKDIPVGDSHPSAKIMRHVRENLEILKDKSKILIWGMKDPIFLPWVIDWWSKIYPGIETHRIENASHFLQEDSPEEIILHIKDFMHP